ncbi:uncharacterized protein LOC144130166 isoform X2 [Amblyomma americanum]
MIRRTVPKAVRRYTGCGLPKFPALLALQPPGPGGGDLKLPTYCTGTEDRVCHLAGNLPALNDLLYFVATEVTEVGPGKLALRSLKNCVPNIPEEDEECRDYAAVFLHYILAEHRCVESAELLLSSRQNRRFMLLLSEVLKSATSLTCLRLCGCELSAEATSNVFAAIQRLLTLQLVELVLDKFVVVTPRGSLDALTEGLSSTVTLKVLKIVDVDVATKDTDIPKNAARGRRRSQVDTERLSCHVQHLLCGLAATKSLRRLALKFAFSTNEMHRLLLAAVKCATLKELHIPRLPNSTMAAVLGALARAGPADKLTVGMLSAPTNIFSALVMRGFSTQLEQNPGVSINQLYTSLGTPCRLDCHCGDHLSSLELVFRRRDMHPDIVLALRAYLPLTRSLRRFDIRFPASPHGAHLIIEGIALNNSIEELSLNWLSVSEEDMQVLCDWVARSRRLHSLQLALIDEGDKMVLQKLSTVLKSSYTLMSLGVKQWPGDEAGLNAMNLVRRNYGLVQCASAFILGSSLKRAAVAFELVSWHPQISTVVQRMGSLGAADAALIRESARRLHDEFWHLAGIVKVELVCNPPESEEDAAKTCQLDRLGYDVLQYITSFLKVSDVLDEEYKARPSRSVAAKRTIPTRRRRRKMKS